jgi:hypothetical protein
MYQTVRCHDLFGFTECDFGLYDFGTSCENCASEALIDQSSEDGIEFHEAHLTHAFEVTRWLNYLREEGVN